MALDYVIRWTQGPAPKDEVRLVLEDYLAGTGSKVRWDVDRFFADLPGKRTYSLRRLDWLPPTKKRELELERENLEVEPRWFEVWPDPEGKCLYVMTRMADELTNAIALGFSELAARVWRGKLHVG